MANNNAPLFLINGKQMPFDPEYPRCTGNPARDYQEKSEQLVKSTRNAKGEVVAQTVNRRLNKFDNLRWSILTREQVYWLKQEIAKFDCSLSYWDSEMNAWTTREYYWGDFSATPFEWETFSIGGGNYAKRPKLYKDIQVNLIDKGYS